MASCVISEQGEINARRVTMRRVDLTRTFSKGLRSTLVKPRASAFKAPSKLIGLKKVTGNGRRAGERDSCLTPQSVQQ